MRKNNILILIFILFLMPSFNYASVIRYSIAVNIMPEKKFIRGYAELKFPESEEIYFVLEKNITVSRVTSTSGSVRTSVLSEEKAIEFLKNQKTLKEEDLKHIKIYYIKPHITQKEKPIYKDKKKKFSDLKVKYYGVFKQQGEGVGFDHYSVSGNTEGIVDERGVFFVYPTFWYPYIPNNLAKGKIVVYTPMKYYVVSEGEHKNETLGGENIATFTINFPVEYFDLVGGEFKPEIENFNGVKIGTFFTEKNRKLSSLYLQYIKKYIKLYEKLFTKYPFTKFYVVENFLQTGYGMPSFTLLGDRVIRLPFIVKTSLGHEILHNWWGNSVYVDYSQGNWCEGLTVMFADYYYRELKSEDEAKDYRFEILKDYSTYVSPSNEISISEFESRVDPSTRTIGYGKSMMFFYMLRKLVGKENFMRALKRLAKEYRFKKASFSDIRKLMEEESAIKLKKFFEQWINKKGAPDLFLNLISYKKEKGKYVARIEFIQKQSGEPYELFLPYTIYYKKGVEKGEIKITRKREIFEVEFREKPQRIVFDEDYEIFRKLKPFEIPPSISGFIGKDPVSFVYLNTNFAESIKDSFPNKKVDPYAEKIVVIIPGLSKIKKLLNKYGIEPLTIYSVNINHKEYDLSQLSIFLVDRNKLYIQSRNSNFVNSILPKVVHYGKYGILIFDKDGKVVFKKKFYPEKNSLEINFEEFN